MTLELGVHLPQVGFTWEELRARVVDCDRLGIPSVWFMDHLYPPAMPRVPSFEAWTTVAALAPLTQRVRLGHLVLCNQFRHPALLAKMAITLDHASGGRLNLGLGSGSYPPEFEQFGIDFLHPRERATRLGEALEVIRRLFVEEAASFTGHYYQLRDAPSLPRPVQHPYPPIHVGGAGERLTLPLVARYADVWNCPTYALTELPRKLDVLRTECARIGRDPATLRVTEEAVLALVATREQVAAARALAERRFGGPGWGLAVGGYVGTPDDIVARMRSRMRLGVTGFIFFFHDRAQPESLRLFAQEVVPALAGLADGGN
jgi:alkanesulfonate monooxygenase SsuD/methylene tetrahydromethanopterin reductase-like flavin-dependent oxidoreductase (luciferase family)